MSNEGFSNDSSWKAFKLTLKFIWWCIKALVAVIGFVFVAYKWYKNRKLKRAEERRLRAEEEARVARARAEEAREEVEKAESTIAETQRIVERKIDETQQELKNRANEERPDEKAL